LNTVSLERKNSSKGIKYQDEKEYFVWGESFLKSNESSHKFIYRVLPLKKMNIFSSEQI